MATVSEKTHGTFIELADEECFLVEGKTIIIVKKDIDWFFITDKMKQSRD